MTYSRSVQKILQTVINFFSTNDLKIELILLVFNILKFVAIFLEKISQH